MICKTLALVLGQSYSDVGMCGGDTADTSVEMSCVQYVLFDTDVKLFFPESSDSDPSDIDSDDDLYDSVSQSSESLSETLHATAAVDEGHDNSEEFPVVEVTYASDPVSPTDVLQDDSLQSSAART